MRKGYSFMPWAVPRYFNTRKPAGGDLLPDPLIEDDHAIRHIFFKAVARDRIAVTLLTGDDRRYSRDP